MLRPSEADLPAEQESGGGLRYVDDRGPGISRRLLRGKIRYFDPEGRPIRDAETVIRLNALAIPPAYTDVWICPDPRGHIQATARDARGRKQYRYHPRWVALRDSGKYGDLARFGRALPTIRRRVRRDLKRPGLSYPKVVATVVKLLDVTLMRIGNREYARRNRSYGLTTLKSRHATVRGQEIRLRFRGKSGVEHDVVVSDRRLARVVARCMEIPGHELFQYLDEAGERHPIGSGDVNEYLRSVSGADFTAKDYRTWAGSVMAFAALQRMPRTGVTAARHTLVEVMKAVGRRLGNTAAVCRRCYVHPAILECFLDGRLPPPGPAEGPRELSADERRLLAFLESPAARAGLPPGAAPSQGSAGPPQVSLTPSGGGNVEGVS